MPTYTRLTDYKSSEEKEKGFFDTKNRYEAKQEDFEKIPGSLIAYWVSERVRKLFIKGNKLNDISYAITKGIFTGKNDYFLKLWFEINCNDENWEKYSKSGGNNKWYGLLLYVLRWHNNGYELKNYNGAGLGAVKYYNRYHIVWSGLTSGDISFRFESKNLWFDDVAHAIIFDEQNYRFITVN